MLGMGYGLWHGERLIYFLDWGFWMSLDDVLGLSDLWYSDT
jgi:hypothetical protein